ncbi:MAG: amidohydrolase family protein [Chitinophagales bacterium]|nr:amidohydrolase family protein [Chitinophagales bacterium]
MRYQKFKATRLFDGTRFLDNSVLITDETGTIEAIVPAEEAGEDVQQVKGILSPGLINCHCHLELSHLKNVIPPHTGLIDFLSSVVTKRGFAPEVIEAEIIRAEKEMEDNGIVAVGDIGNTADTAAVKKRSRIRWQNFVEVLSFTEEKADERIAHYSGVARDLAEALKSSPLPHRTTLVPHAPYSISTSSFRMINEATAGQIISIHNQEHPAEDELYKTGGGAYLRFFKAIGIEGSPFTVTGKSSIRSVLPHFTNGQTIFLIHNTFMPEEDMVWANAFANANGLKLVYCLCINANLYIENKVPPVELLMKHDCQIVLGTDSYSSNWQLNISKEIQAIRTHFPHIPEATLLQWATRNGANALEWGNELGSFAKGTRPGIVRMEDDFSCAERLL